MPQRRLPLHDQHVRRRPSTDVDALGVNGPLCVDYQRIQQTERTAGSKSKTMHLTGLSLIVLVFSSSLHVSIFFSLCCCGAYYSYLNVQSSKFFGVRYRIDSISRILTHSALPKLYTLFHHESMHEWNCRDFTCVRKPTESRLSRIYYATHRAILVNSV